MVNNAGIAPKGCGRRTEDDPAGKASIEDWHSVIATNLDAALAEAVTLRRQGELPAVGCDLNVPRPK